METGRSSEDFGAWTPVTKGSSGPFQITKPAPGIIQDVFDLHEQFGSIDIYLFDQLLRGRIQLGMRILDAGCGEGRNLVYLLRHGFSIFGIDSDPGAIEQVRRIAASLAPSLPARNFQTCEIENMPHAGASFDFVICNAVLHFARDDDHFQAMLTGLWKALKPAGTLFCRFATSIGMANQVEHIEGNRFLLPDGSERYLANECMLIALARQLNATLIDPIKTTLVQDQRAMTTWVLGK